MVEVIFAAITSEYGLLGKIFSYFSNEKISIDVVTTSGDSVSFSCDKLPSDELIQKIQKEIGEIRMMVDMEILAIIGKGVSNTKDFSEILNIISKNNPKALSMNTKDTNLTAIFEKDVAGPVLQTIHDKYF